MRLFVSDIYFADFIASDVQGFNYVNFAAGSTTATLSVPTVDDDTAEPGSNITVWVSRTTGDAYENGDNDFLEITVEDND